LSETWSLTLREEHRLRVFENRVLRRMPEHKRDEVTGRWIKLRNEKPTVHQILLFFSPVALQSLKNLGRLTYRRFL
jgi:hypothetical protein